MSQPETLAEITGKENRRRISLRRTFRATAEELWSALVEPERIRCWFAPATLEPRVGGRIEMKQPDGSKMMDGMIRVFEPPRVLEYDWVSPYETTIVRYELEPDGKGTRLTLTEHLLTDKSCSRRGAGWQHHVERLDAHLRGEASPPSEQRWRHLRDLYAQQL
jgi:uncharacterized protein YndB with AHSA1/START domain